MSKKIISITIDKLLNKKLESGKTNRSKLINFLIEDFFKKNKQIDSYL